MGRNRGGNAGGGSWIGEPRTHIGGGLKTAAIFFGDFMSFTFNRIIGYIGHGTVGKSCSEIFKFNCQSVIVDPAHSALDIQGMINFTPDLVFISLPAPTLGSGKVDYSLIFEALNTLRDNEFKGIVVVKSTLTPDIVCEMFNLFEQDIRLVYSPEFITEKNWQTDVKCPSMILFSGNYRACLDLRTIYERHSSVDRPGNRIRIVDYVDAAMIKYTINTFLSLKVAFFNQIHQVYSDFAGGEIRPDTWNDFIAILTVDDRMGKTHMSVPGDDGKYGYGGRCFPKDVKAFLEFGKEENLSILKEADLYNLKRRLQE